LNAEETANGLRYLPPMVARTTASKTTLNKIDNASPRRKAVRCTLC
jgi:hypothetical protein